MRRSVSIDWVVYLLIGIACLHSSFVTGKEQVTSQDQTNAKDPQGQTILEQQIKKCGPKEISILGSPCINEKILYIPGAGILTFLLVIAITCVAVYLYKIKHPLPPDTENYINPKYANDSPTVRASDLWKETEMNIPTNKDSRDTSKENNVGSRGTYNDAFEDPECRSESIAAFDSARGSLADRSRISYHPDHLHSEYEASEMRNSLNHYDSTYHRISEQNKHYYSERSQQSSYNKRHSRYDDPYMNELEMSKIYTQFNPNMNISRADNVSIQRPKVHSNSLLGRYDGPEHVI